MIGLIRIAVAITGLLVTLTLRLLGSVGPSSLPRVYLAHLIPPTFQEYLCFLF